MLNWLGFWVLHLGFFLLGLITLFGSWCCDLFVRMCRACHTRNFDDGLFFAIARKLFVVLPHPPFLCKFRWTLPPCVDFRTKLYLNLPKKTILIATREVMGCCWDGDIHGRLDCLLIFSFVNKNSSLVFFQQVNNICTILLVVFMVGCDIDNFYITRLVEPTIIIILKKKKKEKTSQLEIYLKR